MTKSPVWLAAFNAALAYYTAHPDEWCDVNPIELAFQLADRAEEMAQKRYVPQEGSGVVSARFPQVPPPPSSPPSQFDQPPPIPVGRKPW